MKDYPVGSICVIDSGDPCWNKQECTIIEGLRMRKAMLDGEQIMEEMYMIDLKGSGGLNMVASHCTLKLLRFPPDVNNWCETAMQNLLKPLDEKEMLRLVEEGE